MTPLLTGGSPMLSGFELPETVLLLAALTLIPFLAVMVTSFAKIAVVLGILRSALGTATVPPTTVLTALALILTFYVMAPVATESFESFQRVAASTDDPGARGRAALAPLTSFLRANVQDDDLRLFEELSLPPDPTADPTVGAPARAPQGTDEEAEPRLRVIVPAFLIGELREAFRIGFLLFLPFLVVDLVVSALTLSLGMHMLSPTTLTLPLKLLLFVSADGWRLLCEALVQGYHLGGV